MRRLIQNVVEDNLSDELLGGRIKAGDVAIVDLDEDGNIVIRAKEAVPEAATESEAEAEAEAAPV